MRSTHSQYAQRVNTALALIIKKALPKIEIIRALKKRYGISTMQAYRYLWRASRERKELLVPARKIVFTVKLPAQLAHRLRRYARKHGKTLSELVGAALEKLLSADG